MNILELTYEANGNYVAVYYYDAWGRITAIDTAEEEASTAYREIAEANPLRYRGYYFDSEKDIKNRNITSMKYFLKVTLKKAFAS